MNRLTIVLAVLWTLLFNLSSSADPFEEYKKNPSPETAFTYLHQVTTHQRCVNCHGVVEQGALRPMVGDDSHIHPMNISNVHNLRLKAEGKKFVEIPSSTQPMNCRGCHRDSNGDMAGMPPGAANDLMPGFVWHMPPPTMLLSKDMTPQQLCEDWLNPAKNSFLAIRGGRDDMATFEREFVHHVRDDPLIRWAWAPGPGRQPAPGNHEDFVKAMQLWIKHGAKCPENI